MADFLIGYVAALFTVASLWVANGHAKGFLEAVRATRRCRSCDGTEHGVITGDGVKVCGTCVANTDAGDWDECRRT